MPKNKYPQYNNIFIIFIAIFMLITFNQKSTFAQSLIEGSFGYFRLKANSRDREKIISNFGYYRISYNIPILKQLDFSIGNSFMLSKIYSGDIAFGLDLGLRYFPITFSHNYKIENSTFTITLKEVLRPFVTLSFVQRQFQTFSNQFAGFSVGAGCLYFLNQKLDLKLSILHNNMLGAYNSTLVEQTISLGIAYEL